MIHGSQTFGSVVALFGNEDREWLNCVFLDEMGFVVAHHNVFILVAIACFLARCQLFVQGQAHSMAITFTPSVGELIECDFGEFLTPPPNPIFNGLIAPEIVKKRLVVVLNGRLPNECVLVVPISSSGNANAVTRGFHVHLPTELITVTKFYDRRDRWAIADCMTHVSKKRLFPIWNGPTLVKDYLPREVVTAIQKAAIKSLSASALLAPDVVVAPPKSTSK